MTLPLDTAPGPSPDAEAERHTEISRDALRNARRELAQGDLMQASEKAWGASAHAVKAVAERRRWFSEADWKLGRVVDIIANEQGDDDIAAYYQVARDAHFNFYRHEYDASRVERAVNLTARLIDKLDATLAPDYAPPYISEDVEAKIRSLEQPNSEPDQDRLENGRPQPEDRLPFPEPSS